MSRTYQRATTTLEPVKKCPYCDEEHFSRSLYGHVAFTENDNHGKRGEVPEGFNVKEAETVGTKEITTHVRDSSDEVLRCKFCGEDFAGRHGLRIHLSMVAPDSDHPEDLNPETAGIRVPRKTSNLPESAVESDAVATEFQAAMDKYSGTSENAGSVPVDVLEDLLDEFRMREPDGAAYVTCARMLEDVIEQYAEDDPEIVSPA